MRKLFIYLLRRPILWISNQFTSQPDKDRIYQSLTNLFSSILTEPEKNGLQIHFDAWKDKFIIFSDQHKGRRNGADDFAASEENYLTALEYYNKQGFIFVNLGDCEELWENSTVSVIKNNKKAFELEKKFLRRNAFVKIFGNHDLYWNYGPLAPLELEIIYGKKIKVHEGLVLSTKINEKALNIFCTHGHQGDARSDGNKLTKFFVANIWAPLQAYLRINPNEPSNSIYKKTIHNQIMYEWSATKENTLLITGHTHQAVFESLTYIERLFRDMQRAKKNNDNVLFTDLDNQTKSLKRNFAVVKTDFLSMQSCYFNTGCCCFSDGDITGIELESGYIRLIKWESKNDAPCHRVILEEKELQSLMT